MEGLSKINMARGLRTYALSAGYKHFEHLGPSRHALLDGYKKMCDVSILTFLSPTYEPSHPSC